MSMDYQIDWWDSLDHSGLLIAPARLIELEEKELPLVSSYKLESLRSLVARAGDTNDTNFNRILDFVFSDILRSNEFGHWMSGAELTTDYSVKSVTGTVIRPRRVWVSGIGDRLPVFIDYEVKRIGVGKGVTFHARAIEWLRSQSMPVGLLFNGRELRLVHAGADYDSWCEWRLANWFFAGQASQQLIGLQRILDFSNLKRPSEKDAPLLVRLIKDSRKGQAEISQALGEQVRKAVELFIREFRELDSNSVFSEYAINNQSLYVAANRLVMRIITVLFAEARELLPIGNTMYFDSYSIKGLKEQLLRRSRGGTHVLKGSHFAWPRILGLFRLLFNGSAHSDLTTPEYFGDLFRPGSKNASDIHLRALALFESSENGPSDFALLEMLKLITSVKTSIKQRGSRKRVSIPVDFSDLSSEYIGILYEGLLDFELHRAPSDSPVVFLNVGNQPGLPLVRLEEMTGSQLKDLFEKLKKKSSDSEGEDEEEAEDQEAADGLEGTETEAEDVIEVEDQSDGLEDIRKQAHDRAQAFAKKAVLAAGLVRRPRGANQQEAFEKKLQEQARGLLRQVVLPNEWYLVRWGGTRKGGGTFYTRPQLALPTVRRTLEPLCYQDINGQKHIRKPEEILALKVCDPAMGSGSFLVGATRFLTAAMRESLYHHDRVLDSAGRASVLFVDGDENNQIKENFDVAVDDPVFEDRLIARIKRHVVEHCIYGVDIDGLAVELAKLAFWVETMDRNLPFSFLDHRLKCGNALIGCNLVDFMHYPLEAWSRDLGDTKHTNGVHFEKEEFTKKKKDILKDRVKPELERWITELSQGRLRIADDQEDLRRSVNEVFRVYRQLAKLPINKAERKRELYLKIQEDSRFVRLKQIMDAWCALWFWEPFEIENAPTPSNWPPRDTATLAIVDRIAKNPQLRFFHWELEFPDVFASTESVDQRGFSAILGNPPWETLEPASKEFFSNLDPLFRGMGKQPAISRQRELFENIETEKSWLKYQDLYSAYANWISFCASPEGKRADKPLSLSRSKSNALALRELWNIQLNRDSERLIFKHRFPNQGSGKAYTYRLFLEAGFRLLRSSGQLGFIVPSGIYSDKGSLELRELFLDQADWQWLFGFENKRKIFDIHRSFKFCPVVIKKGGRTEFIRAAFMRHDLDEWADAENFTIKFPRERITRFSPKSKSILEVQTERDLEILEKIYSNSVLLGDDGPNGWGLKYAQGDYNMTSDSSLFIPRDRAERDGYRPNEYGMWVNDDSEVLLPLYEGRMIGQFDFSQKGWVSGKGRSAVWREIPWDNKKIEPQYLIDIKDASSSSGIIEQKLVFMDVTAATNQRTMIASFISYSLAGHSAPIFTLIQNPNINRLLFILGVFNSFVYDFTVRFRGAGNHLTLFQLEESPIPNPKLESEIVRVVAALSLSSQIFAKTIQKINRDFSPNQIAITDHERTRLRAKLDALIAALYGLDNADFSLILESCNLDSSDYSRLSTLNPKGFWRVDKDKPPHLRHTVLALEAFRRLNEVGLDAFIAEDWQLPERAQRELGPRFLPWQLEKTEEQAWEEIEQHAENIERLLGSADTEVADEPVGTKKRKSSRRKS